MRQQLGASIAVFALIAGTAVLDVAAGDPPANAAAADVANCAPDSPFIYNLHSENGSPSGTDDPTGRSNRIERVDVTTGATAVAVDLSAGADRLTQQLNGLGISGDGERFYFVSHSIDRRAGETIDSEDSLRRIYVYDLLSDTLESVRIPWNVWDPGADHIARHGAVDPATGIYYFATSVQDADLATETMDLVAYDPEAPEGDPTLPDGSPDPDYPHNVWLAGSITAPGVRGNSGDMAFDQYGNLVFVISRTDSVGSVFTVPRAQMPDVPGQSSDLVGKAVAGLAPAQAGGNAVGLAFGQYGYLYLSYTDGTLNRIDPSTGETTTTIGSVPLGGGGRTTDLASCATPSSLTVVKDIEHRYQPDDQFTLLAIRDNSATGPEIGEPATTSGTATGVQEATVGPVPILVRTVEGTTVQDSRDYFISESGAGADLGDYDTTMACVDLLDSSYEPAVSPVATTDGSRQWRVTLTPHEGDSEIASTARAIQCTFTNTDAASPRLTLTKTVADPDGVAGDTPLEDAGQWTLTAEGAETLSGATGVTGALASGDYTLLEAGPDGYAPTAQGWTCRAEGGATVPVTGGEVSLADGQRVECSVTNTPQAGSTTWEKTDEQGEALGGSTWTLTGPGGDLVVADNTAPDVDPDDGAFRVEGLVWGAYTLAETVPPPGYAISSTSTRTFSVGPSQTDVSLGAVVDDPTGVLAITKAYTGEEPSTLGSVVFTGTYVCRLGDEAVASGTWSVTGTGPATLAPDAGSPAADAIVAGATCVIDEDAPAAGDLPSAAWAWGAPDFAVGGTRAGSVVIAAGQTRTMTVTNTASHSTAQFSVVKAFTGSIPSFVADTTFTGTYTCMIGDTVEATGTWSVTGLGAATLAPAPGPIDAAAACTATEDEPAPDAVPDSSWHWGTPSIDFDTSDPDALVLRVTNAVDQALTTLTIHKAFSGAEPAEANGKVFTGTWACTLDGTTRSGEWSATAGGAYGPITVRQGASCTITETAPSGDLPAGWTWGDPEYSPSQSVAIPDSTDPTTVTVTNSAAHLTGALAVTKAWSGAAPDWAADASSTGSYRCAYGGQPSASGTWSVTGTGEAALTAADGSPAPDAIPAGSECTVVEETPSAGALPDGSWNWSDPGYLPAGGVVSIAAGDTASVIVTNAAVQSFGSLGIEKALGDGAPPDVTYTGAYTCLLGTGPAVVAEGTWSVTGSGEAVLIQTSGDAARIPVTSYCRVTEDAPDAADLPDASWQWEPAVYTAGGHTIGTGGVPIAGATTLTVTNSATQSLGALAIVKAYDDSVPSGTQTRFAGTYSCRLNDATVASGTWSVTGTGPAGLRPDEGSEAPDRIPAGSECTAVEGTPAGGLPDASWTWGEQSYDPASGRVTVAKDQVATITVTNTATRSLGQLVVNEEYEGGDPPDWAEDIVVEGRYSCTLDGEEAAGGDWSAAFGESAGPFDVPAGSACTITQDELPPVPDGSWQWEAPVVDPDGPVTIPEGGTGVITVTNRLTRLYGGFTVTKAIAGEGTPDPSLTFAGQWRCVYPGPDAVTGTSDDETATGAWGPVPAGQAWTSAGDAGIPRTSSCVVLGEDEPGPPGPGLEWDGEPDLGVSVTASEQPGEAAITVTNTVAPAPGPTPTPTPTSSPAPSPSSSTSGAAGGGGLSDTGTGAGALALAAAALLAAGALLAVRRPGKR